MRGTGAASEYRGIGSIGRHCLQYLTRLDRIFLIAALLLGCLPAARAHDVPDEVRVQAFVKPEGQSLRLLARVPLKAMRDVDVPRRGEGFLDFARVDTVLRDAAKVVVAWLQREATRQRGAGAALCHVPARCSRGA